jgi:hypothetical protein
LGVKILKFFDSDPGGKQIRIREGNKFGSGMEKIQIRDKHPGSATMLTKRNEDDYRTDRLCFSYLRGSWFILTNV